MKTIPKHVRVKLLINHLYGHKLSEWSEGVFLDFGAGMFYDATLRFLRNNAIPHDFSESTFRKAFTLWLKENYQ